ncbi:MAG: 50S ribosomal protein L10 [Candidatus Diapherotrites archaeon]|nr:50S ribosomal protein L10 [Candidatus Diapherotrites archaeon]
MTSHLRKWKEAKREELVKLAKEFPVIAIATLDELPANITAVLRKKLKATSEVRVAKIRVTQLALKESKIDTSKLDHIVEKSILVIFTKQNPFELFSFVKKNKGSAAAREGDIADIDILIQAGDTGLPPGPALSTLKAAGLSVKVAGPTISISADKIVAKKGEVIKKEIADVLGKLNIKPMKIGMKILGVLDKNENMFYDSAVLDVDEEELASKFTTAYQQALNLAVNAEIFNEVSTEIIIAKAEREAKAVNKAIEGASVSGQ